ncbi:MAG: hypothetical protein CM1200mP4_5240 [Rhodospirillaceae bacterium]|nr:MAG: hypothetical protein CM1200mP4_5240 [Rhodospirillaceae bacterium]
MGSAPQASSRRIRTPNNLLLVADGTYLIFIDRDIDQISKYSYESGPFRFLLRENVDLREDMIVNPVGREPDLLHITLVDEDDFKAGSVIIFHRKSHAANRWTITDPDGHQTKVLFTTLARPRPSQKAFSIH